MSRNANGVVIADIPGTSNIPDLTRIVNDRLRDVAQKISAVKGEKGEPGPAGAAGAPGGVTTFNGRAGVVLPQTGDYAFSQISGTVAASQLPSGAAGNVLIYGSDGRPVDSGVALSGIDSGASGNARLWFGTSNPNGIASDFAPHNLVANTSGQYTITASSSFYAPYRAFDGGNNQDTSVWVNNGGSTGWLKIDLGSGYSQALGSYSIKADNNAYYNVRMPSAWVMQGSDDGSSWDTLDTRSSETSWLADEIRTFTCTPSATAYRYFRITVSATNGESYVEIPELYLYGPLASISASGGDGDFFLDYTGKVFYGPKSGSSWPRIGALS